MREAGRSQAEAGNPGFTVEKTDGLAGEALCVDGRAGPEPRRSTCARGGEKVTGVTTDYDLPRPPRVPARNS